MEHLIAGVSVGLVACGGSYGVVDPMPPPAVCPGTGRTVAAAASFVKDPSGDLLIAMRVDPPGNPEVTYIDDAPDTPGATVVSQGRLGTSMELHLKVTDPASTQVRVVVPVQCKAGKDGVAITLSWTAMAEGSPISAAVDASR